MLLLVIGTKITEERFMMDEPSGVRNDQTETSVDGALAFHGFDAVMGASLRSVVHQRRFSLRSLHIQRARTWAQRNNVHLAIYISP